MLTKWLPAVIRHSLSLAFVVVAIAGCKKNNSAPREEMPELGTCKGVQPKGRLQVSSDGKNLDYVTSGGGKLSVGPSGITFAHNDFTAFNLLFWGSSDDNHLSGAHESLIGKHIKDWKGNRRTIIFPDGAKITIITEEIKGSIKTISIYDGADVHHFNFSCLTLEYSASTRTVADQLDKAEPDGETATFEFTATGLLYLNIYTEDTPGNKIEQRIGLGEIYYDIPNRCNDYYDDPQRSDT